MNRYALLIMLVGLQANIALSNSVKDFFNIAWRYFKPTTAYATESKPVQSQPDIQYIKRQGIICNLLIEANITERKCLFGSFFCSSAIKTVGHIVYGTTDDVFTPEKSCKIKVIKVDEEYRRQGIGSELVKRALADMESECQCSNITLFAINPASRALFSKLGARYVDPKNECAMYFGKEKE